MEFFLILPLVFFILAAGIQVVTAAQLRIELYGAVREGVRVAATSPDPSRAVKATTDALEPEVARLVRVSVRRPAAAGQTATVSATLRYTVRLLFLPDISFDVSARAAMRTER